MKHFIIAVISALIVVFGSSCNHHRRTTTIVVDNNHSYLKIKYTGTIVFNHDNTGILHISPEGYFNCQDNDNKLVVESNAQGKPMYAWNGSAQTSKPDQNAEPLLLKAIKEIKKRQEKRGA